MPLASNYHSNSDGWLAESVSVGFGFSLEKTRFIGIGTSEQPGQIRLYCFRALFHTGCGVGSTRFCCQVILCPREAAEKSKAGNPKQMETVAS